MSNTTNYQVTIPEQPKEDKSGKNSGKSSGKKVEPFLARVRNVQRNLKAPKGQFNKFGNYKYRNAEDILEAAKPLLDENDIVLTIEDELEEKADRLFVKATVFLLDIHDSTQILTAHAYAQHPVSQKGMSDQMLTGSSSSYARKYALGGILLLDSSELDPDAQGQQTNEQKPANVSLGKFNKLPKKLREAIKGDPAKLITYINNSREIWIESMPKETRVKLKEMGYSDFFVVAAAYVAAGEEWDGIWNWLP